jgi:hypothetical protein
VLSTKQDLTKSYTGSLIVIVKKRLVVQGSGCFSTFCSSHWSNNRLLFYHFITTGRLNLLKKNLFLQKKTFFSQKSFLNLCRASLRRIKLIGYIPFNMEKRILTLSLFPSFSLYFSPFSSINRQQSSFTFLRKKKLFFLQVYG